MNTDTPMSLSQEQIGILDKISDRLVESTSLSESLLTGLDTLLESMTRDGAALYIAEPCDHTQLDWLWRNAPLSWKEDVRDSQSILFRLTETAIRDQQIQPGVKELSLGAVIPMVTAGKSLGALLLSGDQVPQEEYGIWQMMLRPFARLILLHQKMISGPTVSPRYSELLRSRNTLRAMFDSLPISIYIIDNAYTLVAINLSRARRSGSMPRSLVGHKCFEALYNRDTICPGCQVAKTLAGAGNTVRMSQSEVEADAQVEWEINTFPIFDEKELVSQAIIIEQDVTEKHNLEVNLIQSEKLAAVGQLAAGVAHEINNPLTAIIANAQLLRREIPADNLEQLDSIKLIELAGTRASQVVRNLLGIARKEKYDFEPVDLNETIQNALSLVQHELVGRPIRVQLSLSSDMPAARISQDQIQGVWINLILNAIDALDKPEGVITIQSRFTGAGFIVIITDNGKGIAQDHLPRVFEPFFTTKSPGRGTGLGLSVCMRAIRLHGGTIQVDSEAGEWTRFTITLPGPA